MRDWILGPCDPLALTLAADFRLCTPDYLNDQIWEIEIGSGDPSAFSLRTTFGLRAHTMRLYPRFSSEGLTVADPSTFPLPPILRKFFPNFLSFDFSPINNIHVLAEYWVPDSNTVSGHFTITNRGSKSTNILLELCGQLYPMEGQSLSPQVVQSVNILVGRSADLTPVLFLTGGAQPGPGPYPSLSVDLTLAGGETRSLGWALATMVSAEKSFEQARRTIARAWEAERAKIEMVNATQTIEVFTGEADWDAAFALSQKIAFGLFFGPSEYLPNPSFVNSRQPDQGYSPRGDGSDYSHLWNGQAAFEACTLASVLSGAPELAAGLVRNFLSSQSKEGAVDSKPGLAGQRGRWLATPLLANLAWRTFELTRDLDFLREVQPGLEAFTRCWFDNSHDRDGDGFPEWDHSLQTGLEDNPIFSIWEMGGYGNPGTSAGLGGEISTAESPALTAMLFQEAQAHAQIAAALGQTEKRVGWEIEARRLRHLTEECWDPKAKIYHFRDRDTHLSPMGKPLGRQGGAGNLTLGQSFLQPVRLLIRLDLKGETTRRPELTLHGMNGDAPQNEHMDRMNFKWGAGLAIATTKLVYTHLTELKVTGVDKNDRVLVSVMDFSAEDVTLFLPMWAGIPDQQRTLNMLSHSLLAKDRFGGTFGIPVCKADPASKRSPASIKGVDNYPKRIPDFASICDQVQVPWNALIGEGLVTCGLQDDAVRLMERLMSAIIQNLKQQHSFARAYHVESGAGIGERNPVQGLAPLGLFLKTIGIRIESPKRFVLSGKNPFPWPVTVKYRGLTITRQTDETQVIFPDGQVLRLDDPTDAMISTDPVTALGSK